MGQVGHARARGGPPCAAMPLEDEPEEQHDPGGEAQRQEEQEREEAGDPGRGEQVEEGAQHRRRSPRRRRPGSGSSRRVRPRSRAAPGSRCRGRRAANGSRPMRSSVIAPKTYRKSMLPSRCSQLPCTNSAVSGVSSGPCRAAPQLQRDHAPALEVRGLGRSRASPVPYTGFRPEAGPSRKTAQHRPISTYVTRGTPRPATGWGADGGGGDRTSGENGVRGPAPS